MRWVLVGIPRARAGAAPGRIPWNNRTAPILLERVKRPRRGPQAEVLGTPVARGQRHGQRLDQLSPTPSGQAHGHALRVFEPVVG